ncbi:Centrosomal protein of 290 kDa [Manis javanica]|nr:Centrosomal protein of 290 kDa [Manis javanica]
MQLSDYQAQSDEKLLIAKLHQHIVSLQVSEATVLDNARIEQNSQQEHRNMENKAMEMELKLKGLEELISTLKDAKGAQKVINWHMKIEELRLQELKLNRELVKDKEEIKYLNNIISEYDHTINSLEEEIVQQNKFHEEKQMAWDQREVELESQLDIFDHQQNEILSAAQKKLKEKESALWLAEQNILSRDKVVISELRLRLPATAEREKLIAELGRKEVEPKSQYALKIPHQTIANMQARLNQKEEVLKKYQHLLEKAREHEEDLHILHHKLELQADSSLSKFKQTAQDLIKQSPTPVPTNKHLIRLAEMEQMVAEQDDSLSSLLIKLKKVSQDLERQKEITELKVREFENIKLWLQENCSEEVKKVKGEVEDLRCLLAQSQKESQTLKSELQAQKEANPSAPTTTMRNLVDRLKSQLALKEKQQKSQIEDK